MSNTIQFEPVIVGFFCNWCAYRAADQAGVLRIHCAHNLRIIRVMCSGRVEPQFVFKAFQQGADGVVIAGCHPGQCHYTTGNISALCRFRLLQKTITQFGIRPERLRIVWASASEGRELAEEVNAINHSIKSIGPLAGEIVTGNISVAQNGGYE